MPIGLIGHSPGIGVQGGSIVIPYTSQAGSTLTVTCLPTGFESVPTVTDDAGNTWTVTATRTGTTSDAQRLITMFHCIDAAPVTQITISTPGNSSFYRVGGVQEWSGVGSLRNVVHTQLSSGPYTFPVAAQAGDLVLGMAGAYQPASTNWGVSAGWTELSEHVSSQPYSVVGYRVAAADGPQGPTFTPGSSPTALITAAFAPAPTGPAPTEQIAELRVHGTQVPVFALPSEGGPLRVSLGGGVVGHIPLVSTSDAVSTRIRVRKGGTTYALAGEQGTTSPPVDDLQPDVGDAVMSFEDDFEGTDLDTAVWSASVQDAGYVNNELQAYTSRATNVFVQDSVLHLVGRQETYGTASYTSGKIVSLNKRWFQYGYIVAKMRIPKGAGLWPAFWTLGRTDGGKWWPTNGEIDILETVNQADFYQGTIHAGANNDPTQEGDHWTKYHRRTGVNLSDGQFHLYAVNWTPGRIEFFLDNEFIGAITSADTPAGKDWPFDRVPHYLLLNLAIGGTWPGDPDSSTPWPATVEVDWVRVYNEGAGIVPKT